MLTPLIFAAIQAPQLLPAPIVSAALYSNGRALIVRQAEVPAGSTEVVIDALPQAALGTFWIRATGGLEIGSATTVQFKAQQKAPLASVLQLVAANIGRRARLRVWDPEVKAERQVAGQLVALTGELLLVKTDEGTEGFLPSFVRSATIEGEAVVESVMESSTRAIRLQTNGQAGQVTIIGLESGMGWSPAYRLDLGVNDRAELAMRAVITNSLAALERTPVKLVAGSALMTGSGALDPFVSYVLAPQVGRGSGGFGGGGLPPGIDHLGFSPADNSLVFSGAPDAREELMKPIEAGKAGELATFLLSSLTLKPGENGWREVFSRDVRLRRYFTLRSGDFFSRGAETIADQFVELVNESDAVVPNGPLVVLDRGDLVAQTMLPTTPAGGEATIALGQAPRIRSSVKTREVSRRERARKVSESSWLDLVRYEATLTLENTSGQPAEVEFEAGIPARSGQAKSADGRLSAVLVPGPDPEQGGLLVEWKTRLTGKAEGTVTWEVYVPSAGQN